MKRFYRGDTAGRYDLFTFLITLLTKLCGKQYTKCESVALPFRFSLLGNPIILLKLTLPHLRGLLPVSGWKRCLTPGRITLAWRLARQINGVRHA